MKRKETTSGPGLCSIAFAQEKSKGRFIRTRHEGCSTELEIATGVAFTKATAPGKKPAPDKGGNALPWCSSIFSRGSATQHPKDPPSGSQENKEEQQGCSTALEIAVGHAFGKVMAAQNDHNDRYLLEGQLKRMMETDKRLVEKDRETIAKRISGKLYGVPQPILGDMLSEEVERYLAEKAKSAKGHGQP